MPSGSSLRGCQALFCCWVDWSGCAAASERMSRRQNWFWLILAVTLAGLVFLHQRYANRTPPGPKRILPAFKSEGVATIQIKAEGQPGIIQAERTNNGWVLSEPVSYPAESSRIEG